MFVLHSILDKGYYCYKNADKPNTIDIYVPYDASDELSDFDFFFDHIVYDQLDEYHNLDKNQRGERFVQWRREIDEEVYNVVFEDFTKGLRSGNSTCETAEPFCTGAGLYDFPAGVNSGSPCGNVYNASCNPPYQCYQSTYNHPGQDNCLYTAPNPAFYFLRIDHPGDLDIYMYSTPSEDIDFDCWGPFSDMNTACSQLSCYNIVDCSYSTASAEHCHIYGAQQGQYYILLITNYSNDPCNIYFQNQSGSATTDCTILPPMLDNDGPYCVGETIHLTANTSLNASYQWTGPNGFTSTERNPTIPNCTMANDGVYMCYISVGNLQSTFATMRVNVYPNPVANFTATTVCQGQATQFNSTSTTNPTGSGDHYTISSYQWNFGDGQTGTGANTTHTYSQGGTYQVTLTVSTGNGHCTDQITRMVNVIPTLNVSITTDPGTQICDGDTVTLTANVNPVDLDFIAPGDILCTDNSIVKYDDWPVSGKTPMGIVFYVNNSGAHGWAVSLNQSSCPTWGSSGLIGTAYSQWRAAVRDMGGAVHTQAIRAAGNASDYPAAWLPDASQGWYLPTIGQLGVLYGELMTVNAGLNRVGGTQITDGAGSSTPTGNTYIWSSTEKSATSAYAIEVQDGQIGGVNKTSPTSGKTYVVRAIIDF